MAFDENNIRFRFAIMSDMHTSYHYQTGETIEWNIQRFANALVMMKRAAGGNIDAFMSCGDYTDTGSEAQARTFAEAMQKLGAGILGSDCKLMIGMGNHDTCWRTCMNDEQWYKVFDDYGLNDGLEDDSLFQEGDLHLKVTRDGKTYHMLYVEASNYATNVFTDATMKWLDDMLSKITGESPDNFVFIGTHGPVKETGVYGSDVKLEPGGDWGTAKDNIHHLLKKYPQVVLFSGHSHMSEYLETTIMQRQYTAINVTATLSQGLYNSQFATYLDSSYPERPMGMGILIEIDAAGTARFSRVDFSRSDCEAEVIFNGCCEKPSPAYGILDGYPEKLWTVSTASAKEKEGGSVFIYGEPWVIPAPDAEKKFLECYSDARGNVAPPEFPNGAQVSAEHTENGVILEFPAAVSESDTFILRYEIDLFDEKGELTVQYTALGNWVDNTTGIAEGNDHCDATRFRYELTATNCRKACRLGLRAKEPPQDKLDSVNADIRRSVRLTVVAQDEYGNYGAPVETKIK